MNNESVKENAVRKSRFQRPIQLIYNTKYVTCHVLVIGTAIVHNDPGVTLWSDIRHNKNEWSLLDHIGFGKYMKSCGFKQM